MRRKVLPRTEYYEKYFMAAPGAIPPFHLAVPVNDLEAGACLSRNSQGEKFSRVLRFVTTEILLHPCMFSIELQENGSMVGS